MVPEAYLKGATWGVPGAAVTHIETHAAHVFLVADRAYKIKKAVKLPYLDFSTRDKRAAVLARELELNRAFAPQVYLRVDEIEGEPVLVMNRFATGNILANRVAAGHISDRLAAALAAMLADTHERATPADISGDAILKGLGAQLSVAFTASPAIFPPAETLEFHALFEDALHRLAPLLNSRAERGLVRRCHGDLHCGNIVLIDENPVPFDAIEFSERIATIDVLYDLAFLLMDLGRYGERRAANIVFNRYLDLRRRDEDLSGLACLPLFLATRAGVRALVTADLIQGHPPHTSLRERGQARDYFRASIGYLKSRPPMLVAVGGLSGAGKTTVATGLAPEIGEVPGAVHIRSDIERKRLAGVAETERLPPAHYTPEKAAAVYEAMLSRAEAALKAGRSVVLDAVFSRPAERFEVERLALKCRAKFAGFWLDAPPSTLRTRVSGRQGDASDADEQVVHHQLDYDLGDIAWQRIDAGRGLAETLAAVRRILPPEPGARS